MKMLIIFILFKLECESITGDYVRIKTASLAWKGVRHGKEDPEIMSS